MVESFLLSAWTLFTVLVGFYLGSSRVHSQVRVSNHTCARDHAEASEEVLQACAGQSAPAPPSAVAPPGPSSRFLEIEGEQCPVVYAEGVDFYGEDDERLQSG